MKLVLLGVASLMCVSMAVNANMSSQDQSEHNRRESEISAHEKRRDELNAKIAELRKRHVRETSRAHVRHAENQHRTARETRATEAAAD